ncbi:MAG: hypothetical protein KGR18_09975 [Acidobacteria bacterium]|nr:hypothetical protein [Acidobacteriota bacterium]
MTESSPLAQVSRPARAGRLTWFLILLLTVMGPVSACSSSNPTSGSAAIPTELSSAIDQMQSAESYSFVATMTTAGASITVDGTFSAPNTVEQTIRVPGRAPVEMRLIGTEVSIRNPVSGTFTAATGTPPSTFDLRRAFGALRAGQSVSTNGTTHTFTLDPESTRALAGSDATGSARVMATTDAQGFSRLEYRVTIDGRPSTVGIDYHR